MTNFSDGFAQGFGLVDDAIQRRRKHDLAEQQMGLENARYLDRFNRQQRIDQRDQEWRRQDLESAARQDQFEQEKYRHQLVKDDKEFGLREAEQLNNNAYRQGMLENQIRQTDIHSAQAGAAINASNADTAIKSFQLRQQQEAQAKQEALKRFSAFMAPNPDGTAILRLPGGEEGIRALEDFKLGTGVDALTIAKSYPEYKHSFAIMQQAIMNPGAFAKDQTPVLRALNTLESVDINKGNGAYDGEDPRFIGGTVDRKEITGILYHPPQQGYPEGFYSMEVTAYGKDANGKPYADSGPMTEFRSSSLYDKNVRGITPEQLVKRLTGHEALIQLMDTNPQLREQLAGIAVGGNKKERGDFSPIVEENYNPETMANEKRVTGAFDKNTGNISRVPEQPPAPNPADRLRRAQYILDNQSQFQNRPDMIQAAREFINSQ